jgi:hypothetical protein
VSLSFVEHTEGATLVLHVESAAYALLLSGSETLPITQKNLERWAVRARIAKAEKGELRFEYVPAGHARVLLVPVAERDKFHLEELELPAEGVLERELHPRWQPMPRE